MPDDYETCVRQERAYTDGWRDCGRNRVLGGHEQRVMKFYARGWTDRQTRDRCDAMYARKDEQ